MKADSPEISRRILTGAQRMNIRVSESGAALMERHARLLAQWNRKMNLTRIAGPSLTAQKHYLDSLAVSPYIEKSTRLLDIGPGAGFPSMVLKMEIPTLDVLMVEASAKKVSFLKHTIRTLELSGVDAVHSRAEDPAFVSSRAGRFDRVISRAAAGLDRLVRWSEPFIGAGGKILAMKGKNGAREITAELEARYSITIHRYRLPVETSNRMIIELSPGHPRGIE